LAAELRRQKKQRLKDTPQASPKSERSATQTGPFAYDPDFAKRKNENGAQFS